MKITSLSTLLSMTGLATALEQGPRRLGRPTFTDGAESNGGIAQRELAVVIDQAFTFSAPIGPDTCFNPVDWCDGALTDTIQGALANQDIALDPPALVAAFNALVATYCNAATGTLAALAAFIQGEGLFEITRSSMNGAVKGIDLFLELESATLALQFARITSASSTSDSAESEAVKSVSTGFGNLVDISESADSSSSAAQAKAFASASALVYVKAEAEADAKADADANSLAEATATAFSSATSLAGTAQSLQSGVSIQGKNIREFSAELRATASSFALAETNTTTFVDTFAAATTSVAADVSATVNVEVDVGVEISACTSLIGGCRRKLEADGIACAAKRYSNCAEICSEELGCKPVSCAECLSAGSKLVVPVPMFEELFDATVDLVAESFIGAVASALAAVQVEVAIPAYFKNEIGTNDTYVFPQGVDQVPITVTSTCTIV